MSKEKKEKGGTKERVLSGVPQKPRISRMEAKRRARKARLVRKAKELLRSPYFFNRFLDAVRKAGLVGEEQNALALFVVVVSRLLQRPLNAFLRGQSSTGKNWLVGRVLKLVPKDQVRELTSSSLRAWNYAEDDFKNRVVYLQEQNEAAGSIHPARLLISEKKIVHTVLERRKGGWQPVKHVARGPITAISTTTREQLAVDDETRNLSLWVDDSREQTRRILVGYLRHSKLSAGEVAIWKQVQRVLAGQKKSVVIGIPKWFRELANRVPVDNVRVRRYFAALVEACCCVCLIRFLQRDHHAEAETGKLTVNFTDFAIAAIILDRVFVESLRGRAVDCLGTRQVLEHLVMASGGKPVDAKKLATALKISEDRAYKLLSNALRAGMVKRANNPSKNNHKVYLPDSGSRFIPDPAVLFQEIQTPEKHVKFVHPVTGQEVVYNRRKGRG